MSNLALCIIDDDPADLALMAEIAEEAFPHAEVHLSNGGEDLQDAFTESEFDCVLLDYRMPGDNGLSFARKLRSDFPYLPIIMSTSFGDEMLAARAVRDGVSDYIPKSRVSPQSLRRTIENAIQMSNQARTIDEQRVELENFAYALAHDFKQPIRQIKTFSSLVEKAVDSGDEQELKHYLGYLRSAAGKLGDLVDVMSLYTLLNQKPEIGIVDLNAVLASVAFSLTPYLEERGGLLITGDAPSIRGNETLMQQVLQNLVLNGLRYNRSETPTVWVSAEKAGSACQIVVKDNGIGIDPQYWSEIFKPLARLHTNAEFSGSGLGLTLARKALAAQGGSIYCRSEVGQGSEFFVQMPLAESAPIVET